MLESRLAGAGVTDDQVAVAWLKMAHKFPTDPFPAHAIALEENMETILANLHDRFPNLVITYVSSRSYAGYATGVSELNPEPFAYESGFAVQELVTRQAMGAPGFPTSPWLDWGPYLWADGLTPRADGLTYACDEFEGDGTHPGPAMEMKIGAMLLDFFQTDPTAREWFLAAP